jgi:hypothetical protein
MWLFGAICGLFAGGAIMYYVQPQVKDAVAKAFAGAPALLQKAEDLKARADELIAAARAKQA